MNSDILAQLVRYILLTVGPIIVSHGWVTDQQWLLVVGAAVSIATAIWGCYVKWNTTSVNDTTVAHLAVPTVSPVTGKPK